jgi:ABC-type dipeptide/oligopeptide/nickel transport system permease component
MFNYRGLGLLIRDAAEDRDIPMLMGAVFIVGAISMVLNLIADILTAWLNPRIRLGNAQ